uniref:Uncharacterized protein n=1 Tax=Arundo donax TaxID=35708 RepID=A0A0A9GDT3_ARUDO
MNKMMQIQKCKDMKMKRQALKGTESGCKEGLLLYQQIKMKKK